MCSLEGRNEGRRQRRRGGREGICAAKTVVTHSDRFHIHFRGNEQQDGKTAAAPVARPRNLALCALMTTCPRLVQCLLSVKGDLDWPQANFYIEFGGKVCKEAAQFYAFQKAHSG